MRNDLYIRTTNFDMPRHSGYPRPKPFDDGGNAMKALAFIMVLALSLVCCNVLLADDDHRDRWWERETKDEYWDGPCRVKTESKGGEFKREIKCKDGVGAWWGGEWKREFRDGRCFVKQEAKYDEFKEEVKCEP